MVTNIRLGCEWLLAKEVLVLYTLALIVHKRIHIHSIFLITYKWAQKARVFASGKLFKPSPSNVTL